MFPNLAFLLIIDDLCSQEFQDNTAKIKKIWGESEFLKGLMNDKIESSKKKEENNLVIKEMLKILEQANLNSNEEILELESLENKLVNNLEINNSIKSSLDNLNNFSHDEPSVAFFLNQSIKNLNRTADFDLKIKQFREKLLNIQADVEDLIFDLSSYKLGTISSLDTKYLISFPKKLSKT